MVVGKAYRGFRSATPPATLYAAVGDKLPILLMLPKREKENLRTPPDKNRKIFSPVLPLLKQQQRLAIPCNHIEKSGHSGTMVPV